MKKKILILFITSIFLLTSIMTLSALGKKTVVTHTESEGVDLELTVKDLKPDYWGIWPYGNFYGYEAHAYIKNIGDTALKEDEYPNMILKWTAEKNGEKVWGSTHNLWYNLIGSNVFEPGDEMGLTINWGNSEDFPIGATLSMCVDPERLIPENDEMNNDWAEQAPKIKTKIATTLSNSYFPLMMRLLNEIF